VVVPFICLTVTVGVLISQLWQVTDSIEQQSRARKFVNVCYQLESQVVEAFCDLRTTTDDQGMVNHEGSIKQFVSIRKRLRDVVADCQGDPTKLAQARAIQNFWTQKAEPFKDWFLSAQSQGEAHWKVVNEGFPLKLIALCDEFLTMFTALTRSEQSKLTPEKVIAQWSSFKQVPIIAIGVSVLFALLQGTALAFTIKKPLSRISENCRRMAVNEELQPALSGRDELSELDRLFHVMAQSVDSALAGEKAMIDNARDLICSLSANGVFTKTNASSLTLLGYQPEELIDRSLLDVCTTNDTAKADEELQTSVSRTDMRNFDLTLQRKDGSTVDTRWSCVWSERDDALFAVVHDITEEKNIERLKQDFVDMISHDLRSPLTSMLGSLSMIEQGAKGPLPDDAQAEVESAVKNVERLVEFINDLLDFQKLKSGRMQLEKSECNLEEIVTEAIEMVKASADLKHVTFKTPKHTATINGDKNKLLQVVVNLVANAIRYAPEGSDVEIRVRPIPQGAEMQVIDSGPGVPTEYREQIFDAFQQLPTQKSKEGTGLGLAICKLIVDAHGGQIGVSGTSAHDLQNQTGKLPSSASEPFRRKPNAADATDESASSRKTGSIFWVKLPKG
jgi:PAS domain S-box-containing protein